MKLKIMKAEKRTLENKLLKSGTTQDYKLFNNKCNKIHKNVTTLKFNIILIQ